jgi:CheY-like chemotaxis protein
LRVINDILDFSKIEAGKLELENVDFDLRGSIEEMVASLQPRAREKSIDLVAEVDPDVPAAVCADVTRVRQVLANLVGNALKFTAVGSVHIHLGLEAPRVPHESSTVALHFSVRDTGAGIPPEKQHSIFEPFVQADNSTTRRFGGTGLGLSICSRLVKIMGGRIWLESQPGRTTFHFAIVAKIGTIKSSPVIGREAAPTVSPCTKSLRILLAEDNLVNQMVAGKLLERRGYSVVMASSGQEAVDRFQREPIDLVLMDVQMPDMDGFQTTAALRALERATGKHVPIIAMTAHAMKGDKERCLGAGMDGYLSKPIRPQALYDKIEQFVPVSKS